MLRIHETFYAPRIHVSEETDQPCRICGNSNNNAVITVPGDPNSNEKYNYTGCGHCGSLTIEAQPHDQVAIYDSTYYSMVRKKPKSLVVSWLVDLRNSGAAGIGGPMARMLSGLAHHRKLELLRPLADGSLGVDFGPDARIIDVGSGAGSWLMDLASAGYRDLTGIDPFMEEESPNGHPRLLRRTAADMEPGYALVACHHALEHMPDPQRGLSQMVHLLSPDGVAIVGVPLVGSYGWRRYGGDWVQLDAPRHATLFSDTGFHMLCDRLDLEIVKVRYDSTAFMVLGSEARLAGVGPHDGARAPGPIAAQAPAMTRMAREIADYCNRTGSADQASYYIRRRRAR